MPTQWYVLKTTFGNVCRVELATASPIGERHLGPFNSKFDAIRAMCADLDDTITDPQRCWTVAPADACKQVATDADAAFTAALTLAEVRQKVAANNHSPFSTELVVAVCWAESSFKPDAVSADPNSTSKGLMMMNKKAVDTVNANTPAGTRFSYDDMLDANKAIACGTWYLRIIYTKPDWHAQGNKRETLRAYRGRPDYVYVDKVLTCETCLQTATGPNQENCLRQVHPLT